MHDRDTPCQSMRRYKGSDDSRSEDKDQITLQQNYNDKVKSDYELWVENGSGSKESVDPQLLFHSWKKKPIDCKTMWVCEQRETVMFENHADQSGFDRRQFMGRLRKQATRKNIEFQERNMWKMIVKVYC